jgi:hypothetical protein
MHMNKKLYIPLLLAFAIISAAIAAGKSLLEKQGGDFQVLLIGNVVVFVATLISSYLMSKGIDSANTNAFVRNVYGGFIVKMMVCLFSALIYFMSVEKVNKPALLILMPIYFIYTAVEVRSLMKLNQLKKNAQAGSSR